ncbi:carbohydrate porin [Vibrio rotiferianus]|uniref:carbohydrate porin n=1 Tax=Vibrio rotiferianus TaxID=190895 RepID=UPI0003A91666|nr:carbohydrate porin [Vibrio rotiferianus]PIB12417.1 carbohydrate-selective porin OprB [Vibrio rotiferianus CAIM 577 = LMG 21460]
MKVTVPKLSSIALSLVMASSVNAANFGSPNSVDNTITENTREKRTWRELLAEDHNLTFGLDYQALGLTASDPQSAGEDAASAGVARFYGSWNLVGLESGNTGGLVWKVEHRHAYSKLSPKEFSFIGNGLGYAGMIGSAYSDQGARLTNLYWQQQLNGGKTAFMVGFLDTSDYVDTYALASPWTGFTNLAFSTGGGAIGLPDDGILGLAVGHMLTDNFYMVAGVADGKGRSDNPFDGFDTLFNDHKLFTTFELGWTASQDQIYTDNVHLTAWHLDGDTQHNLTNKDSGQGINFSASYFATEQLMPFVRGGFSEGDVALYDRSLTVGIGYFGLGKPTNNLGFAVNWSHVNDNLEHAYGVDDSEQFTAELYYNMQLNDYIQITPDIQYIKDPAFSNKSSTWVLGLRARIFI